MAEDEKLVEQTPKTVANNKGDKPGSIAHAILTVFLALLVVAVVSSGVFYFAVKNNINGLADTLRPSISNNPILRLALPKVSSAIDPDDPKNLSQKELLKKYDEYRTKTVELNDNLSEAYETIGRLTAEVQAFTDSETAIAKNEALIETIKKEQSKLDEEKKTISRLIAEGDKEGFREYFQKVDKVTAEAIYKEILEQEQADEEKVGLAKSFAEMEPGNAANVLAELFRNEKETALDIFEGLKPDSAALIVEKMDVKVAAEIYRMLSERNSR